jgi:hypothetical protein
MNFPYIDHVVFGVHDFSGHTGIQLIENWSEESPRFPRSL